MAQGLEVFYQALPFEFDRLSLNQRPLLPIIWPGLPEPDSQCLRFVEDLAPSTGDLQVGGIMQQRAKESHVLVARSDGLHA